MAIPSRVQLIDVGPRDGLQNEKQPVPAAVKVELVHRLQQAGLKEIEVTSFVSPKWVPQMADNAEVMAGITRIPGVQYSVREFVRWSAAELGITLRFEGTGVEEIGVVESIDGALAPALNVGDVVVRVDPRYFRPAEVETLLGDPTKAKTKLGWTPEITVQEMCAEMVREDLKVAQRHALLKQHGHDVPVATEN